MTYDHTNPTVKRLLRELKSMTEATSPYFLAYPLEDNLFCWHFTLLGPPDSPYAVGYYHGKLLVPSNYPFSPPDIVLLTPSGRFQTNKKICVSISSHHPENWKVTYNLHTVLLALREFMSTAGNNAIGALEYPDAVRKELAKNSWDFVCHLCGQSIASHRDNLQKNERNLSHQDDSAETIAFVYGSPAESHITPDNDSETLEGHDEISPTLEPLHDTTSQVVRRSDSLNAAQTLDEDGISEPSGGDSCEHLLSNVNSEKNVSKRSQDVGENASLQAVRTKEPATNELCQVVINAETLDWSIAFVLLAIFAILIRKWLSGTLDDVAIFAHV